MGNPIPRKWLSLAEARAYSGLGKGLLRRLADEGELVVGRTPGGHRRWDRQSIDDYMNRGERAAVAICARLGL